RGVADRQGRRRGHPGRGRPPPHVRLSCRTGAVPWRAGGPLAEGQHAMTGPEERPGDGSYLGVDLGTSHTVAMLRWSDGRTRPLLFDGQPLVPSAVFLDTTGRLHVGRDAPPPGSA